jgi:hypothetical protein
MTRMAEPGRPQDDLEDDEQRFEDEGRRSIFSALWFRAILVVVVLGVVAAVAVPYVLELANQPAGETDGCRATGESAARTYGAAISARGSPVSSGTASFARARDGEAAHR